jgi:23S rRNA (guanosine2251-2'-O)-methyltransferase
MDDRARGELMPGNSARRGRRSTAKKGAAGGSGGKGRDSLKGRGKTLPAEERPWHKAYSGTEDVPQRTAWKQEKERRAATAEGRPPKIGKPGSVDTTWGAGQKGKATAGAKKAGAAAGPKSGARSAAPRSAAPRSAAPRSAAPRSAAPRAGGRGGPVRSGPRVAPGRKTATPRDAPELLVGRNPVVEALRSRIPATALYVALGIEIDDRITEAVRAATDRGIPLLEISRAEFDRITGGVLHQGIGLSVPPYSYESFDDLVANAIEQPAPLLVALDGVTDPRNLGAVVRSAAAFGAHGVFLTERRAAGMTATAWRTSAGAAARIPISQVTNLTRSIKRCQDEGFTAVGLDADGATSLYDLEAAVGPLVVVVGSEGRGLSRLVGETCDLRVSIPMMSEVESLNASVAAAVALAEVARRRQS